MKLDLKDPQTLKAIAWLAIGIIGLIVLIKFTKKAGETFGIFDTEEEKEAKEKTKKAIEDFSKEAQKTIRPTRSAAQWALVADTIYDNLKGDAVSDDKEKAYNELARILNDADAGLVLKSFGLRQEYGVFGIPFGNPKTLVDFVQNNFSVDDVASLNSLYSKSKMKFKF
jgi:hypothetical protein